MSILKRGPNTLPCETPISEQLWVLFGLLDFIVKVLFVKYGRGISVTVLPRSTY